MSITLKRWEPVPDFSRQAIKQAVTETRLQDHEKKQKDFEQDRKQWRILNPIRTEITHA